MGVGCVEGIACSVEYMTNYDPSNPYAQGSGEPPTQQDSNQIPLVQPQYGDYGAQGNAQQQYGQQPPYGQPQYGQYNQGQYGNGYPPKPAQWNGLCIAGFVCSFFIPVVGLILSIIALTQINRTGGKSRGMAIAGIVISVVVWACSFAWVGALGGLL